MSQFLYSATLNKLLASENLEPANAKQAFHAILSGQLTAAQIAGFVIALRMKGETASEVASAAQVMRELVTPVSIPDQSSVVDLCGTGGDGAHTFNISTACMFILAGCNTQVAKHGGRSVSSSSGSADVLEALGANIGLQPAQVANCMASTKVGFMFAPNHHAAMRFAGPVRKELGVRTVFNILGPLTNPAGAKRQVMGVYSKAVLRLQAEVLKQLGSEHALIVHGASGMDEISLDGPTHVAELKNGVITEYDITPESIGLSTQSHDALTAHSVDESMAKVKLALGGQGGSIADIVAANAGAGLYVAGKADSIKQGVSLARDAMSSGAALRALESFVEFTQSAATS